MAAQEQQEFETLRLEIAGSWAVVDMAQFLATLERFYDIPARAHAGAELPSYPQSVVLSDPMRYMGDPWLLGEEWRLRLLRIRHESPGFVDLIGIGKVVKELRLFTEKLIDLKQERRRQGLEDAYLIEQTQQLKVENLRATMQLLSEADQLGLNEREIRHLALDVDKVQDRLAGFIEEEKVTGAGPAPEGAEAAAASEELSESG